MSDRYREYGRQVIAEMLLALDGELTRYDIDNNPDLILDGIPAPAPTGKAWAEKVRDHVVDTWVPPELRDAAKSLCVESLQPSGTTTPDVQAQVDAAVQGILEEIVRIDDVCKEQIAQHGYVVGTPGGLEHMGDVWSWFAESAAEIRARSAQEKGEGDGE